MKRLGFIVLVTSVRSLAFQTPPPFLRHAGVLSRAAKEDEIDLDAPPPAAGSGPSASDTVTEFLTQLKARTYNGDPKSLYPLLAPDFLADGGFDKNMETQVYKSICSIAKFEILSSLSGFGAESLVRARVAPTNLPPGFDQKWVDWLFKVKGGMIASFEPELDENGWVRSKGSRSGQ